MRNTHRKQEKHVAFLLIALAVVAIAYWPSIVQAQVSRDDAAAALNANNHDEVESGIQNIGMLGDAAGIEPLAERIRRGLPADLLELSVMTLLALGEPSAGPVLFDLATHRRPKIRALAIEAIAAIKPAGAQGVLVAALSDNNAEVRAKAAFGLGEIKAAGSIEALFRALDLGVLEASEAIGRVITANRVTHLLEYLNKIPLHSLGPALITVLGRPDVATEAKLEIVKRLEELATPEVKNHLVDFLAKYGETAPKALIRAVRNTIQQIAD